MKKIKTNKIDWEQYFDAMWCINYCNYADRKESIKSEFERLGISEHQNFYWKHTSKSVFDGLLYNITKQSMRINDCKDLSIFNLAMAHYDCIKNSYELGYNRIMIVEDDIRFLKNTTKIKKYLDNIPDDADIVLFSQNMLEQESILSYRIQYSDTSLFKKYDYIVWDSGCYMLSRKAMKVIMEQFERRIKPFDNYTSARNIFNDVVYYYSSVPIAVQLDNDNALNGSHYYVYENMGLDLKNYGIHYSPSTDNNISFKLVIPAYNSEKTIKRCIQSVKKQNYKNFHVVIVDDCSTDRTNEIIRKEIKGDSRFELITLKKRGFSGGARNRGIHSDYKCDYVAFLDSDDYYISCYVFDELQRVITLRNNPDCVLCSFFYQNENRNIIYNINSVESYIRSDTFYAPWTTVVKSDIVPEFEEGVRYDEDVVFHFKLMDRITSIDSVQKLVVNYSNDNKEVSWIHNTNKTKDEINLKRDSILHNLNVLSKMQFKSRDVFISAVTRYNDSQLKTL